jgi:hypothetical protein
MSDDPKKKAQDRNRIKQVKITRSPVLVEEIGVSPKELKAAVKKVGSSAAAVQKKLRSK